jgi:hypothetical protein
MKKTAEMSVAEINAALFGTTDARAIATASLVQQMLDSGDGISDLIFSPGRPPQVERFGELATVSVAELPVLRAEGHCRHRPRPDSRQRDLPARAHRHRLIGSVVAPARSLAVSG